MKLRSELTGTRASGGAWVDPKQRVRTLPDLDILMTACNEAFLRSIGDRWCMVVVSSCREMLG